MKQRVATGFAFAMLACAGAILSACGGGSSRALVTSGGSPHPTPGPTSPGRSYQVRIIIGFSGARQTQVDPAGKPPVLPPRATDGGSLAGAKIIYPDGSVQTADSSGVFLPSQSSYALKYQKQLQTSANAQPLIIAADPLGKIKPSTAHVSAYASASVATSSLRRRTKSTFLHLNAVGTSTNLAGVSLLPDTASMLSSDVLELDAEGTDVQNNVADLSTATLQWGAQSGTVIPIDGTSNAYYIPPTISGSLTDQVSLTVSQPSTNVQFTASSRVVVVDASQSVAVSGNITNANNSAMSGGLALFAQAGLPRIFAPNYWLGSADNTGAYSINLPATTNYSLALGVPDAFSPTGSYGLFVGATNPGGQSSFNSGPVGGSPTLNLQLPGAATPFSDLPPELQNGSLPSFVTFIRNAWYASVDSSSGQIFEANSGIQPLLASVPTSFPSPAQPAEVGSGQYATWCYQWEQISGVATLVLMENSGASCSQPGNDGFTVTSQGNNQYAYVKFAANAPYSIAAPLDVVTNALIVEDGNWSQTLTMNNGQIATDNATVTDGIYDAGNQALGSPVYTETLQYAYSVNSSGLATTQYSNDTITNPDDGNAISVLNLTKSQVNAFGPAGCPAGAQCFSVSGNQTVNFYSSDGNYSLSYAINGSQNGDGSATYTYKSTNANDNSYVQIPIASTAAQNAGNCLVCPGSLGAIFDIDGTTQTASFTVNNARLVSVNVLDPSGNIIDGLGFIL